MSSITGNASASEREGESGIDRRSALKVVAAVPLASWLVWSEPGVMEAQRRAAVVLAAADVYEPKFFTAAEWKTVRVLADLIIPRDARSGSATDVGVPEFMDFMMIDHPSYQDSMRRGLAWFDAESQRRYGQLFVDATAAQHKELLDQLAWPKVAPDTVREGVAYFILFRNLTLTGFWTTKVGIEDLQYQGNTFVPRWEGCPPAALAHLGVSYDAKQPR